MRHWYDLRILGPLLIATALAADVTMRFALPQNLWFRAWELAKSEPIAGAPFRANFVYDNPRAYGDLANLSNCESCRNYRPERFTTDERGFRNVPTPGRKYTMLLTGDSFGAGSGLNDNETLNARLEELLPGQHIYNASGAHPEWTAVSKLLQSLAIRDSVVIWEQAELHPFSELPLEPPPPASIRLLRRLGGGPESGWYRLAGSALRTWTQWSNFSPLKTAVQRGMRRLENDQTLPNPGKHTVERRNLTNARQMLFFEEEIQISSQPRQIDREFYRQLQAAVRATGNELLVVLTPTKYTVYRPQLDPPVADPNPLPLSVAASQIAGAGIPVVDLTASLREQAAREQNYYPDDTHWNAKGVQNAAVQVAQAVERLRKH